MRLIKFLLPLLLLVTIPYKLYGQSQDNSENPATVIMKKVVEKMIANEELKRRSLNFKKHFVDTKLDDSGRPKKISTDQIIEIRPPRGDETLIQEDGEPRNKRRESGNEFTIIVEALTQRFDYEMAKPTADCLTCPFISKDDKAYMVINFRAKGNIPTGSDDIKEIMNRSAGKMYIDVENLYIHHFESNLIRAYGRIKGAWQLRQADSTIEQGEFNTPEGKVVVVTSSTIKYAYRIVLWGETRGVRSWEYQDYKYVP